MDKVVRLMIEVAREEKVSEEAKEEAIKSVFDERKQAHDGSEARQKWLGRLWNCSRRKIVINVGYLTIVVGTWKISEAGSWSDIVRSKPEVLTAGITRSLLDIAEPSLGRNNQVGQRARIAGSRPDIVGSRPDIAGSWLDKACGPGYPGLGHIYSGQDRIGTRLRVGYSRVLAGYNGRPMVEVVGPVQVAVVVIPKRAATVAMVVGQAGGGGGCSGGAGGGEAGGGGCGGAVVGPMDAAKPVEPEDLTGHEELFCDDA
nr:hypothetical protein [Tanacetum cinerariifolium]